MHHNNESSRWSKMNEKHNKGGRPTKEKALKKSYKISIKFSTLEYYSLLANAKEANTNKSEYIRECIKKGFVKERLTAEHSDLIRKLAGMANNLNQITRRINTFGFDKEKEQCHLLITKIDNLIRNIGNDS